MARFQLNKGDRFSLDKSEGLSKIRVELTWESEADLDAEAFCLGEDGIIIEDADFVYYNSTKRAKPYVEGTDESKFMDNVTEEPFNLKVHGPKRNWKSATVPLSFDESVVGSWDDPGQEDESDTEEAGETIRVNLERVRPEIREIVFTVTIHEGNGVTFKDVNNAKITIINIDNDEELCSYALNEKFGNEDAVAVGELSLNDDGEWEFVALGNGYEGGLQTLIDLYA